jgi:hypothetical protein
VGYVYVLTNQVMPGVVKIGYTDGDVPSRLAGLYSTGVPLPFDLEFAAKVSNATEVEKALHTAFSPYRVNPKREFFRIEPEQAVAILRLLHVHDETETIAAEPTQIDAESLAAARKEKERRPNLNFSEMGIPQGAVLTFTKDEAVKVTVIDDRRVCFGDDETSLTAATKVALGIDRPVAPGPYWRYEGRALRQIYNETYGARES